MWMKFYIYTHSWITFAMECRTPVWIWNNVHRCWSRWLIPFLKEVQFSYTNMLIQIRWRCAMNCSWFPIEVALLILIGIGATSSRYDLLKRLICSIYDHFSSLFQTFVTVVEKACFVSIILQQTSLNDEFFLQLIF
jgi:hypothetical protein